MAGAEGLGLACRLGQRFCFAEVSTGDPRPSARGFGAFLEELMGVSKNTLKKYIDETPGFSRDNGVVTYTIP